MPELKHCAASTAGTVLWSDLQGRVSAWNTGSAQHARLPIAVSDISAITATGPWFVVVGAGELAVVSGEGAHFTLPHAFTRVFTSTDAGYAITGGLMLAAVLEDALVAVHIDLAGRTLRTRPIMKLRGVPVLDVHVGPVLVVSVLADRVCLHDAVSLRLVAQKRVHARHAQDGPARIAHVTDQHLVLLGGAHGAVIWNATAVACGSVDDSRLAQAQRDHVAQVARRHVAQSISHGLSDWQAEQEQERHVDGARARWNIAGLSEEEMVAYAQMLSGAAGPERAASESEPDEELQRILQLSLVEQ